MADLSSSLQRTRIHRALSRPNLLMGADRELVLVTGLASIILIFVVLTWISALFGLVVWSVIVADQQSDHPDLAARRADPEPAPHLSEHVAEHRAAAGPCLG